MALQFILGNSGSGKTRYIHENIIRQADADPNRNFLVIVPEQFTMQTQRELVSLHPGHSIMNIDVLSFNRLAYRVFDETGGLNRQVLEETGKNLILRKVAQKKAACLTVLKKNMTKMGYIGEVKSLISELSQYNVTPQQLSEVIEKLPKGSFSYKLNDVLAMYQGFLDFLEGRFITAEETLTLLSEAADASSLLKDSVIALDGFTGFTPVQNQLLGKLLKIAEDIYVTASIDIRENPWRCAGIHELFYMSKKMIKTLAGMADKLHVEIKDPIVLEHGEKSRFQNSPSLHFLEQNLFRQKGGKFFLKDTSSLVINSLKNPREEMHYIAREIARLVRRQGYRYREIAIVCGDLPGYETYAQEVFEEYHIPLFLDQKTTILFHPFIEFLRSVLEVLRCNFSNESVFRYLRSGMSGVAREDVDLLENYCLAAGVRGRKKWSENFCYLPPGYEEESLAAVNEIRNRVYEQFVVLCDDFSEKNLTVEKQTYALYRFLTNRNAEQFLKQKELYYEAAKDLKNAKEYAQIYRIVMDLFDKMTELLGDETMTTEEYAKILDAGFEAAKVGILPPGHDRVVFGDIERTRLDNVKVLFFAGVNDGVIPKTGGADGILSQQEREQLFGMKMELAPTVREKTFLQRFYLYLNLTKPSEKLYLSYVRVDGEGKARQSSYLIHTIVKLYENLSVCEIDAEPFAERIVTAENARGLLIEGIEHAQEWKRTGQVKALRHWASLCRWYECRENWKEELQRIFFAAKLQYKETPISLAVTKALYGRELYGSVTRLEKFASCAFSHFLSYGLNLKERAKSGFYAVDYGNIFHEVLELFSCGIERKGYSWFTITGEESEELLLESMEQALISNHNPALYENARSRYAKERMYRILKRTVNALLYQVRKGKFTPDGFEVSFSYAEDLDAVNFQLTEEEKMHLGGRIDRIDTYETDDRLYVKVIDYKSGNTGFQFLNIYHGLQLQLVVYMNAALELMQKRYPKRQVIPAGIFYYHVRDPVIETDESLSGDALREKIFAELKLNGIANEDREVLCGLDAAFLEGGGVNSDVVCVGTNKDGSIKKTSKTLSAEDFLALSSYVNETVLHLGQRMMEGKIAVSPYALSGKTGCDYCEFRSVCHFDAKVPGYQYRRLKEFSEEELIARMKGEKEA